ncbi:MAG: glycoside hydrolase family 78 protein [Planctomycetota bacterium]|nr:glycoside hydrolase family 78 protein [Planctomycetota bacterium]
MAVVNDTLAPARLRCEYRENPLGIDVIVPRLSWEVADPRRGAAQTAYRILVASDETLLDADKGDLWDTGVIPSSETSQVEYAGNGLSSRMRCHWKVRSWDALDRPSPWSPPALWTMGLMRQGDWQAKWIGYDGPVSGAEGAPVFPPPPHLRKAFTLEKPVRRATLYATAKGLYELHLNGRPVADNLFTPGWTDFAKRIYYQTFDVTGLVRQGENAIGAILAPGWYGLRDRYGRDFRLLAQLEVEHADGSRTTLASDGSWKAACGPILAADLYDGESYDARKELPGWAAPGFADGSWAPVLVAEAPKTLVQAYPSVPVRRTGELKALRVTEPRPGAYLFDLGQNFTGWARLRVNAAAGTAITLRFAEVLEPNGSIHTANLRSAKCTDTYICKGGGEESWEPRFTFHGFRYVEVTGYPGRPPADAVTGVAVNSDTPQAGTFECSNPLINRFWQNTLWTQRGNFLEIPTDCPQRDERLGWTGDAQIFIRTATCNMDVAAFFTKWLVDLDDAQTSAGSFPDIAPRCRLPWPVGDGNAAWGDAGVICPWTIHWVYGDRRVLGDHYEAMTRWIAYLEQNSTDLLRPAAGYGDWVPQGAETPKDVLATACFARSAHLVALAARVLGKADDAEKYEDLCRRIKAAFNKAYVSADGRIAGDTQTCYVLALDFDLLPQALRAAAAARLVRNIGAHGDHVTVGFVGVASLMQALTKAGKVRAAYALMEQETFPSWLYPVRHGATSIWERWNGWTEEHGLFDPGMNSFSHYAFGIAAEWLFTSVAGIDTDGPGFRRIIIRPRLGGRLTHAKAVYHAITGEIASAWRLEGGAVTLDVTLPANTTATVYVPAKSAADVSESGQPAAEAEGVKFLRMEGDAAVYAVGAGRYTFVSR